MPTGFVKSTIHAHPLPQASNHGHALLVDIVQRELVHRQDVTQVDEPVDHLSGERRARTDNRQLHATTSGVTSAFARTTSE
jgi:hypothetical protein